MKKYLNTLVLLLTTTIVFGQSNDSNCGSYFPLEKGTTWTQENFNKKGKLTSTSTTLIKESTTSGSKIIFTLEVTSVDAKPKKDEEPFTQDMTYVCEDGNLSFDMSTFISPEAEESYANLDITVEQDNLVIPASLSKGEHLSDGKLVIKAVSGLTIMSVDVVNRIAQGKEAITTDSGTYSCMLITYDVKAKIAFLKVNTSVKEWISPEVGIVKSETYDKKGKLMDSSKLKSFSK